MNAALVLTIIGRDRPGLVEGLASIIAEQQGNWLESRMSRLGGEFAGILRLTVPVARESALLADLSTLQASGLTVLARRDDGEQPAPDRLVRLDLVGQDRPGIIRQIATALAAGGANVEELTSECVSAPMTGEPLFKAHVRLALPATCDLSKLREQLERIAADLLVDVDLAPITP